MAGEVSEDRTVAELIAQQLADFCDRLVSREVFVFLDSFACR